MRVLVTGGAGFIGANLCRRLVAAPMIDRVVVLDDLSTGRLDNLAGLDVELQVGSVLDELRLERAMSGCEAVVHLAALPSVSRSVEDPVASHHANATGTLMVLEAARRHGGAHAIVAGSSSVYGRSAAASKHEDLPTRPASPYAASKLAAEGYALAYGQSYALPVLVFRFFNVYGPLQSAGHAYAAAIPAFIDAALAGAPVVVHGDGSQTRDFTFVDAVTAVIVDALARRVTADTPVNLAFGTTVSLNAVIEELARIIDTPLGVEFGPLRTGDVAHSQADCARLHELFPAAEPVPLAAGLRATVEWLRARHVTAR